jgi:hypothetical protein
VADYAHNFDPERIFRDRPESHSCSQGIHVAKRPARQLFVNDGDRGRAFLVLLGKIPPADQRDSLRRKITWSYRVEFRCGRVLASPGFEIRRTGSAARAKRQPAGDPGLFNARDGFHPGD